MKDSQHEIRVCKDSSLIYILGNYNSGAKRKQLPEVAGTQMIASLVWLPDNGKGAISLCSLKWAGLLRFRPKMKVEFRDLSILCSR